jgi:ribose transport system substrate-binding protein
MGLHRHPTIQHRHVGTPIEKIINAGVPVIDMDTLIAPLDQIDVHSFLAPDNEFMGAAVTQVLMDQIRGEGIMVPLYP